MNKLIIGIATWALLCLPVGAQSYPILLDNNGNSTTDERLIYDAGNNRLGINTLNPQGVVDIKSSTDDNTAFRGEFPTIGNVFSFTTTNANNAAPFEMGVAGALQAGTLGVNPVGWWGYNARRTAPTEPTLYQAIEARWNPVGNVSQMEYYFQHVNTQGVFDVRPFGITMQRDSDNAFANFDVTRLAIDTWPRNSNHIGGIPTFDFNGNELFINYGNLWLDPYNVSPGQIVGLYAHRHSLLTYQRSTGQIALGQPGNTQFITVFGATDIRGAVKATSYVDANNLQLLSTRRRGWATTSGAVSRAAFDPENVTTKELAKRFNALLEDMRAHGLIGN